MLYQLLSFVCRTFVVLFGLVPIVAVESAPDHFFGYFFVSVAAGIGCYVLFQLSKRFDRKTRKTRRAAVVAVAPQGARARVEYTHAA